MRRRNLLGKSKNIGLYLFFLGSNSSYFSRVCWWKNFFLGFLRGLCSIFSISLNDRTIVVKKKLTEARNVKLHAVSMKSRQKIELYSLENFVKYGNGIKILISRTIMWKYVLIMQPWQWYFSLLTWFLVRLTYNSLIFMLSGIVRDNMPFK